jgi:beta-galactosidase
VWAYYNNADEVELFLNGKPLGTRKKTGEDLHVMWRVPFSPGTLKAVSRKNGATVLVKEIKTAGHPYKLEISADRQHIRTGKNDLCFITARVVDKNGIPVPTANNSLRFSISGGATIAGTDNGYQADTSSLVSKQRKAWKGQALVIVRSAPKKGNSTLTVTSPGLVAGRIQVVMD